MSKSTANTDDDLLRPEFETILKTGQKQPNTFTVQQPNVYATQQSNPYAPQQTNTYARQQSNTSAAKQADTYSVAQINKPPEQGTQEGIYEKLNFTSNAPKAPIRSTNPFAEDVQKPPPINQPFSLGTASTAHEKQTEQNWAKPESHHCKYF